MKNKTLKRLSLVNLITGYTMMLLLFLLVTLNSPSEPGEKTILAVEDTQSHELFTGIHTENPEKEVVYRDRPPLQAVVDRTIGIDYGRGIVLDDEPDVLVARGGVAIVDNPDHVVIRNHNDDLVIHRSTDLIRENLNDKTTVGTRLEDSPDRGNVRDVSSGGHRNNAIHSRVGHFTEGVVDLGLLEKEIRDSHSNEDLRVDGDEMGNLTLVKERKGDFDIEPEGLIGDNGGKGGYGTPKGDLYAYNYPSQGVGAGIGAPAIGAGVGSAGIGAGIGEAVLDGKSVPALGGVGTQSAPSRGGAALLPPTMGGVGGLVSGAGAGGAAGLVTSTVKGKLGLGVAPPSQKGCALHGEGCAGHHGGAGKYDFTHLPRDGALHIMMHVDGSGSILNTRKTLEIMKDSLLKSALLPYYNNDESLYNQRVSIVDSSGERTLQFFNEAAAKDNVLALVFQDEAQPSYHLPNFNKHPESQYLEDLTALKASLSTQGGLYRGVMFQVDRGRTFAKSFKEFVENSFQGKDYLENDNLKKYYWKNNKHHIDNKNGVVFSDMYHTKDDGSAEYYLALIFKAAQHVGLDLNIHRGGLTDGKYIPQE